MSAADSLLDTFNDSNQSQHTSIGETLKRGAKDDQPGQDNGGDEQLHDYTPEEMFKSAKLQVFN